MSPDPSKGNGISAQMLKGTAHGIAPSLMKVFNISLLKVTPTSAGKPRSVVPIPKSENCSEAVYTDYRPISLL